MKIDSRVLFNKQLSHEEKKEVVDSLHDIVDAGIFRGGTKGEELEKSK